MPCDLREIEKDIEERDYRRQCTGEIAPLKAAEDARFLDSSEMDIDQGGGCDLSAWLWRRGFPDGGSGRRVSEQDFGLPP